MPNVRCGMGFVYGVTLVDIAPGTIPRRGDREAPPRVSSSPLPRWRAAIPFLRSHPRNARVHLMLARPQVAPAHWGCAQGAR